MHELLLVAAAVLGLFVGGRTNVAVAAWLAPGLLLAAVAEMAPLLGALVAAVVLAATAAFAFRGQIPMPLPAYLALMAGGGLTGALPYLAHAVASDALPAPVSVLAFPLVFVALDVAGAASSPFGVWGSPALTQHANRWLVQVVALGGGGMITGLLGLSAAALALSLAGAPGALPTLVVVAAVVVAAHVWGAVRLSGLSTGTSVRVTGLVEASAADPTDSPLALLMQDERLDDDAWERLRFASTTTLADLVARTEHALRGGARLVVWAEGAGVVLAGHEDEVVAHVADLARRYDGHVALALAIAHRDGPRHVDNRVVLVDPRGDTILDTRKARPVPGAEANHTMPGDGALAWVDTALGRIGVLVCFDLDLPQLSRQAAANRIDILLVPASDWPAIAPLHTEMAVLPAIANGCTVVRPTRWGRSAAIDPHGRLVATADHIGPGGATLWAEVPGRRVETPYARLARYASTADRRRTRGRASASPLA